LAILNSFLHEQQQAEEEFNAKFNAPAEANSAHEQQMSVADFRRHFKEDWQQSQFWCMFLSWILFGGNPSMTDCV